MAELTRFGVVVYCTLVTDLVLKIDKIVSSTSLLACQADALHALADIDFAERRKW